MIFGYVIAISLMLFGYAFYIGIKANNIIFTLSCLLLFGIWTFITIKLSLTIENDKRKSKT